MAHVIDQNFLRDSRTEEYLSRGGVVILPEIGLFEIFKSEHDHVWAKNIHILKSYPSQVQLAHGLPHMMRKELKTGQPMDMSMSIDISNTSELQRLLSDPEQIRLLIHSKRDLYNRHAKKLRDWSEEFIRNTGTSMDNKSIIEAIKYDPKSHGEVTDSLLNLSAECATHALASTVEKETGKGLDVAGNLAKGNSVIFRYILCYLIRLFQRVKSRCLSSVKNSGITNDLADLDYVVLSTYFDGLLSRENWLLKVRSACLSTRVH